MISIIICSLNNNLLDRVISSINDTIGCGYEVISIDNKNNKHSIFTAYNAGATKAKYEILCFVHEDIEFYSKGWGDVITKVLNSDKEIGLIGACGGIVKTELPTSWVDIPSNYYVSGLTSEEKSTITNCSSEYQEVVVIDGLFMATTKSLWERHPFPKRPGFHGYDLYYSLAIGSFKKVVVITGIEVLHKSRGSFSEKWFEVTLDVHKEFNSSLPRFVIEEKVSLKEIYQLNVLKFIAHLHKTSFRLEKKSLLILKYILFNRRIDLASKAKAIYYWTRLIKQ